MNQSHFPTRSKDVKSASPHQGCDSVLKRGSLWPPSGLPCTPLRLGCLLPPYLSQHGERLSKPVHKKWSLHGLVLWVDWNGQNLRIRCPSWDRFVFMEEKLVKCSVEVPAGLPIQFSHLPSVEPLCTSVTDGHSVRLLANEDISCFR